ncbi:putative PI-specific phospholipase C group protein [Coniochaeta sp. 2T2.1]|nr:putative PI-specific phospholipase C group protein [Coniochaeta sp. 2T2.1]
MWCFSREKEDASLGTDELSREKGAALQRKELGKQKKDQGIRRLPTFIVRNKRPPRPIFDSVINTGLLGARRHDSGEIAYLPKISQYLAKAFEDASRRRDILTRDGFVDFLRRVQGDDVDTNQPLREEYTSAQFLEEWIVRYGLGALGDLKPDQKDLSKPISNYFISSSHNTYLEGHQLYSQSSSQIYQKVLDRHCRCIEIDVWDGDTKINTRSRSKSPDPTHKRHHSSSSLPSYEGMKQRFIGSKSPRIHNRQASAVEPLGPPISAEDSLSSSNSSHTLDPEALSDRLRPGHARSKSSNTFNKKEPVVMHAWKDPATGRVFTLTNPVGFREVCKAVKNSAFSDNNHLPIIVSLEVHARSEQQEIMVDIMKEEWAGYLLDEPLNGCDPLERQPRLEELLDKILVKVKRPTTKSTVSTPKIGTLTVPSQYDDDLSPSDDERCERTGEKRTPICEKLAALAIYTHSEHFKALGTPSARTHSHIFSIVEGDIRKLYEKNPAELLRHNRHYMMRAYPHPIIRIGSHNPDPSFFWRKGVQMVALNWQDDKYDKMALHDAMFTDDTQGWVLKPRGYRSTDEDGDKPDYKTLTLRITIYRGCHIPLPGAYGEKVDGRKAAITGDAEANKHFKPSVQVDLAVSHEKASGKLVQKTTANATEHPDWGPGGYTLEFVHVPHVVEELSFVR